ncbi:hypothetical protein [Azospirillum argentinense]|uniref:hypothetical protein n=1 Tax=Azospirillum argentinense TaxID=2970906 RepID=UPI0032DF6A26
MSFGLAVKELDSAGGAQLAGTAPWYRIDGQAVVVQGDPVAGHGNAPHGAPVMVEGESWFRVAGVPVCRAGHAASCGHVTTGRNRFRLATFQTATDADLVPRRGTYFFGGAGMEGGYLASMVEVLANAGIGHVAFGNRSRWQIAPDWSEDPRRLMDAWLGVELLRRGEAPDLVMGIEDYGTTGAQFNLIGYSYGSLAAAQVAIKYARRHGGVVDHLVLIGSPVSAAFLKELRGEWRIRRLIVIDLAAQGDPIYAGMTYGELLAVAPILVVQMIFGSGHFWYSEAGEVGHERRCQLAEHLYSLGLR